MRVVIQRVKKHVEVEGKILGEIGTGLLILLGIHQKISRHILRRLFLRY